MFIFNSDKLHDFDWSRWGHSPPKSGEHDHIRVVEARARDCYFLTVAGPAVGIDEGGFVVVVDQAEVVKASLTKAAIWDELKDRLEDNAFRLSVGQQQRVCIARTLATSSPALAG